MVTLLVGGALAVWAARLGLAPRVRRPGAGSARSATSAPAWPARLAAARRRLRPGRTEVGLPEAVDALAGAVAAGRAVAEGLELAARAAPPALAAELRAVVQATARGVPLATAVDRWAASSAVDGARLVATAVGLAGDAGGDVAAALAGVADTLRERRALGREIRALSAQARLSASTIAVAPLGFGAVALAADGDTAGFLLGSPGGFACLAAGLLLDLTGFRWMRRLTEAVR